MEAFNKLLIKIENAPRLDFGSILNQSIELFKKTWVQGLIMLLLTMLLMLPLYIVMYVPMIALGLFNSEGLNNFEELSYLMLVPLSIFILVMAFFAMVITFGIKASFYRICKIKDLNKATPDDYFYYLKRPYLSKVIGLSLANIGIIMVAVLLCFLPVFYVIVPIALMNVVFAFNPELTISEIVKASFQLGNKKWLLTFGIILIAGLMAQIIGFLMCCVGVFITASFAYLPAYFVYKESIGFDEKLDNDTFGISFE